ncbi:hypothetical protein MGN70_009402 [Eutypa lata]|nr:hypothetical protein MGN70_009402 [Eutypa lata]
MSPITCRVLDFDGLGIKGLYVTLEAHRDLTSSPSQFESFTNSSGEIEKWFACDSPQLDLNHVESRQFSSARLTFSISDCFGHHQTPWVTLETYLNLNHSANNSVALQFGPGNSTFSIKHGILRPNLRTNHDFLNRASIHGEPRQDSINNLDIHTDDRYIPSEVSDQPPNSPLQSLDPPPSQVSSPLSCAPPKARSQAETPSPLSLPSPQLGAIPSPTAPRHRAARIQKRGRPQAIGCIPGGSRKRKVAFEDELGPPKKKQRLG